MRVLFSADWHIKLGQKNVPREWQANRFRMFFEKIEELECDLHVAGGDIFDKLPTMEELALFFEFVNNTKHETIIFDGNHEATKKGATFLHYLVDSVSSMNQRVEIITEPMHRGGMDFLPYTHLKDKKAYNYDGFKYKILFTHVRGEIPPHVHPEVDLDNFSKWDIVYAGDLHSHSNSQRNIIYPGSPMTISFHRNPVKNGVVVFDTENPTKFEWIELGLPQLLRKTVDNVDDIVATEYDHTVFEVEGNLSDISKVDRDNELLDKTIVSKSTEAKLDLKDLSIGEELATYLEKVLEIKNAEEYVKVFNDYNKTAEL